LASLSPVGISANLPPLRKREGVKKSQNLKSGQGDVGKTVERLPFSGVMIRTENHAGLIAWTES